eukprot:SM000027S09625  [mRNA]  locus=s27:321187:324430:- [translate_table: standard]
MAEASAPQCLAPSCNIAHSSAEDAAPHSHAAAQLIQAGIIRLWKSEARLALARTPVGANKPTRRAQSPPIQSSVRNFSTRKATGSAAEAHMKPPPVPMKHARALQQPTCNSLSVLMADNPAATLSRFCSERVPGAGMHASYIRPGGVAQGMPKVQVNIYFIQQFAFCTVNCDETSSNTYLFWETRSDIDVVTARQTVDWSFGGIILRGSISYEIHEKQHLMMYTVRRSQIMSSTILDKTIIMVQQCITLIVTLKLLQHLLLLIPQQRHRRESFVPRIEE